MSDGPRNTFLKPSSLVFVEHSVTRAHIAMNNGAHAAGRKAGKQMRKAIEAPAFDKAVRASGPLMMMSAIAIPVAFHLTGHGCYNPEGGYLDVTFGTKQCSVSSGFATRLGPLGVFVAGFRLMAVRPPSQEKLEALLGSFFFGLMDFVDRHKSLGKAAEDIDDAVGFLDKKGSHIYNGMKDALHANRPSESRVRTCAHKATTHAHHCVQRVLGR